MVSIDTPAAWWALVDSHWDDLMVVVAEVDLDEPIDELSRWRQLRDQRLAERLTDVRRAARRRFDLHRNIGWRLLADLCLDRSILHQGVVWRV